MSTACLAGRPNVGWLNCLAVMQHRSTNSVLGSDAVTASQPSALMQTVPAPMHWLHCQCWQHQCSGNTAALHVH